MKSVAIVQEITTFGAAFRRYLRHLVTLLRYEMDIRRHAPFETILHLCEPIILIATLTVARFFLDKWNMPPVGDSAVLFYSTGFVGKYLFIYISRGTARPIPPRSRRFPVEQRLDHMIIRAAIGTVDYSVLALVVFGFLYIFVTPHALPYDIVPIAEACMAFICMGFGWGMFNYVMVRLFWPWAYIVAPANRALVFLSGAFFVPDFMPPAGRYILSWNPSLHAVILFRQGFYPKYPDLLLDTNYLIGWVVFALLLGFVLERVTQRNEGL